MNEQGANIRPTVRTSRKRQILDLIDVHKYVTRGMVQQEFCRIPSGQRVSQRILASMVKQRLLNRFRIDSREQYIYHTGKLSEKWRHWLAVNEFHFALTRRLKVGQGVLHYQLEYRYSHGQADALYVVKTKPDGGILFFLEADDGANSFDKVENYERYYMSRQWTQEAWADPAGRGAVFPVVVCITPRRKEIERLAQKAERAAWLIFDNAEEAAGKLLGS